MGGGASPTCGPWRDGWRHLKTILLFSPSALFLVPGLILLGLGLLLMAVQLFAPMEEPLRLFGFRMDFHWAMLGSLLAIVGYQIVLVNFFAKLYAMARGIREEDRFFQQAFRLLTLERVLLVGAVAVVLGMALDGFVAFRWLRTDLGPLVSGYTRVFIFGSTLSRWGADDLQRVLPEHPARRLRPPSTIGMRSALAPVQGPPLRRADRVIRSLRLRQVGRFLPAEARVLDVGCYDGALFARYADRIASGVGLDPLLASSGTAREVPVRGGRLPFGRARRRAIRRHHLPRGAWNTCRPPSWRRGAMPAVACWRPAGSSLPPCPPLASTTSCTC